MLDWLIAILTFPIKWFWEKYKSYKDDNNILGIFLIFLMSLSGVAILGIACIAATNYLFTYHLKQIVAIGVICWLYIYIRDKYTKQEDEIEQVIQADIELQAERGYPIMRNVIFQTAKSTAPDIGGKIPRLLGEIEMPESHYIISDNLCFYQFRLMKEDMTIQYTENDLNEFKSIFQTNVSHKIESGAFPNLKMEKYRDQYGNFYDSIIIDTIEDIGNILILHAVFSSHEYAEYRHQIDISKDALDNKKKKISESWEDNP